MTRSPRQMPQRILLTNDDGIDGEGLAVLEEIAHALAPEVWVVAPTLDSSGGSTALTIRRPLRVHEIGPRRYRVDGTPADCVAVALAHVMPDARPDLVLSGVNRGANLAEEVVYSGTVGAATTAQLMGVPAIALSQTFRDPSFVPWDTPRTLAPAMLRGLLARGWPEDVMLNINFPDCPPADVQGARLTRQGHGMIGGIRVEAEVDHHGDTDLWLRFDRRGPDRSADCDIQALRDRHVSITPLGVDRSWAGDRTALQALIDSLPGGGA
ncbi:5'/3'-nucleotidase SurE [Tistrella bauzanensis]|uniref:5'-nucleotidase SurE n=1 Tax=Tistrella arctica TaxID=3133430 RepID=A0ABU9YT14_9PROT